MPTSEEEFQERLVLGLGWFSIGLGLAQLLAPRKVARSVGLGKHHGLMRVLGIREIMSGVGILSQRKTDRWVNSRVAGDAMDLALLGAAFSSGEGKRGRVAVATAAVAGVTALDVYCSQ